jgi:hypothetical protein
MTAPGTEAVGLNMQSRKDVAIWMCSLEKKKCPCMPSGVSGKPAYFVAKPKRGIKKKHAGDSV